MPAKAEDGDDRDAGQKKNEKEAAEHSLVFVNNRDVLAAALFEELACFQFGKTWIARFDDQEKSIVGHAAEPFAN